MNAATPPPPPTHLTVWIDQDLCTGDGLCVQESATVFELDTDGLAYVRLPDGTLAQRPAQAAAVPAGEAAAVRAAAQACPARCIHLVEGPQTPTAALRTSASQ